jgi:hypothetical protein
MLTVTALGWESGQTKTEKNLELLGMQASPGNEQW